MSSEQKPTVGRVVHYFDKAGELFWQQYAWNPSGIEGRDFHGPFCATVVYVHDDGSVSLRVDFPSRCDGSDKIAELVERVRSSSEGARVRFWTWPPRV